MKSNVVDVNTMLPNTSPLGVFNGKVIEKRSYYPFMPKPQETYVTNADGQMYIRKTVDVFDEESATTQSNNNRAR